MRKRKVDDSPSSLNEDDVFGGETYRYRISPEEVKDRVIAMKDYLKSIAETPPAESVPQPHLERHQAWILLRGSTKHYRKYETYTLGADTFSYFIYPDVLREVDNLFKQRFKKPKGFVPPFAEFEAFLKYNLPEYIRDQGRYITSVLAYEAVTKIIMDLEKCSYEKATGIGLGEELPTSTPYGIHWQTLIEERDQRRETIRKQQEKESRKLKRKQKRPRKLRKTVPYHN